MKPEEENNLLMSCIDRITRKVISGWVRPLAHQDCEDIHLALMSKIDNSIQHEIKCVFSQQNNGIRFLAHLHDENIQDRVFKSLTCSGHKFAVTISKAGHPQQLVFPEVWHPLKLAMMANSLLSAEYIRYSEAIEAISQSHPNIVDISSASTIGILDPLKLINEKDLRLCGVVTFANGTAGYWDMFYDYYGGQFGNNNLFVCTERTELFTRFELGGIFRLPQYDDRARAFVAANLRNLLSFNYKNILICDVDEFITPLDKAKSLADWVESNSGKYTAVYPIGIDVVESSDVDEPIDKNGPITGQRKLGIYNSSLSKPNLFPPGTHLGPGHHYSTVDPLSTRCNLSDLMCLHMKYACSHISKSIYNTSLQINYHDPRIRDYALSSSLHCRHPAYQNATKNPVLSIENAVTLNTTYVNQLRKARSGIYYKEPLLGNNFIDLSSL